MTRALGLWVAAALAAGATTAGAETLVLSGGTVHTVSGPVIENGSVVVVDGKITAVGDRVTAPAGARTVSCAGKHVYPGFVAALSALGLTEINSVLGTNDWQEIGAVNPNIRAETEFNPESELIPVARANGITSALVTPRGGTVAGTSALLHLDGWTFEDMAVRAPVGLHVFWPAMTTARGAFVTASEEEQRKAREQAIADVRTSFEDARAYWKARDAEGKAGVPRHDRDVKWDAMGKALRGEIPVMFHASSLAQIRAVLRFVDEQKIPRVVLVNGDDAWRVADELKARDIAVISAAPMTLPRRSYEPYDAEMSEAAKLQTAGVRFCISDQGTSNFAMNARNLPYHAAMAAAYGLPREEALKSITLYPAQILGVGDQLGSIEVGKIADLIVADGDPLEIATHVEQVYIAGKAVSMETRQTRLFEKYNGRPKAALARQH